MFLPTSENHRAVSLGGSFHHRPGRQIDRLAVADLNPRDAMDARTEVDHVRVVRPGGGCLRRIGKQVQAPTQLPLISIVTGRGPQGERQAFAGD